MADMLFTYGLSTLMLAVASLFSPQHNRQTKSASRLDLPLPAALLEFLQTHAADGSGDAVATRLSQFLRDQLGCERIIFLARRHDMLEVIHFHGVPTMERDHCRIPVSEDLVRFSAGSLMPRDIAELEPLLPAEIFQCLLESGCDTCMPVVWRRRLYGLYFLRFGEDTSPEDSLPLLTALVRAVSATCHLEVLEDQYADLQERVNRLEQRLRHRSDPEPPATMRVLRLVRHRNSETLVGHIIDEVQRDLELDRYTFVYESRREDQPLQLFHKGVGVGVELPPPDEFRRLVTAMKLHDPDTAIDLRISPDLTSPFSQRLLDLGMKYAVAFPVSRKRSGMLAWDDAKSPEQVIGILRQHRMSFKELMDNAESFERVEEMSYTDNLTGLANRRYFNRRLIEEIGRAKRYGRSLGLIMLDLDELKSINDRYGHQAGDELIRHLGEILRSSIRSIDVIARYGGDEFCVIMPESDRVTCLRFMNRLKQKIITSQFMLTQLGKEMSCTISQGGAVYPDNGINSEQLIFAADMALLQSKETGKNRYHLFEG